MLRCPGAGSPEPREYGVQASGVALKQADHLLAALQEEVTARGAPCGGGMSQEGCRDLVVLEAGWSAQQEWQKAGLLGEFAHLIGLALVHELVYLQGVGRQIVAEGILGLV